jgi:nitrogen fixation NifU-like protein
MGTKESDCLQQHTLQFLEMAFRGDRRKVISNPDGYGKNTGTCGDTIEIFLTVRGGRIESICYETDGCLNTNACCNTLAEMSEGKTLDDAWEIYPDTLIEYLQTLPPENHHCAELAVGAFYQALADFEKKTRNS